MMHVGKYFAGALLVAGTTGTLFAGDFGAAISVDKGSTATVTLEVEISTSFGIDTDDSTATKPVLGTGEIVVDADVTADISKIDIPILDFDLGSAEFSYSFFCLPIIGCQSLDVSVSNFFIGLQKGGVSETPDGTNGSAAYPEAPFVSSFDYAVGGLADIVGSNVVPEVYSFSTAIDADGTTATLTNLVLDPIVFEIDPKDLPFGINYVQITAIVDLSNVSLSGSLEALSSPCAGDFNDDGSVDGADFGSILAQWGACGVCDQDLDNDGVVGGSDIGAFLALWGPCP